MLIPVRLKNGRLLRVDEASAASLLDRGGATLIEPGGSPVDAETVAAFDPAGHTVAEVNAYLREHLLDSDRVMAAERMGKGRKGILAGT